MSNEIYLVLYGKKYSRDHRMRGFTDMMGAKSLVQGLMVAPHDNEWSTFSGDGEVGEDKPLFPFTLVKRWVNGPHWIELHEMEVE